MSLYVFFSCDWCNFNNRWILCKSDLIFFGCVPFMVVETKFDCLTLLLSYLPHTTDDWWSFWIRFGKFTAFFGSLILSDIISSLWFHFKRKNIYNLYWTAIMLLENVKCIQLEVNNSYPFRWHCEVTKYLVHLIRYLVLKHRIVNIYCNRSLLLSSRKRY